MADVEDPIVVEIVGSVCIGMWTDITQWESSLPEHLDRIHQVTIVARHATPADGEK